MNPWLQMSIDYANQRNYLDDLYRVYPTIPEGIRDIEPKLWRQIEVAFDERNNGQLLKLLLGCDLFPIKDSYVAYFKRDSSAIERNPETVNRICGRLYEMGLTKIQEKATEPKETNRQIGPLFSRWVHSGALGIQPVGMDEFKRSNRNAILSATDSSMMAFAKSEFGYDREKGLDFVARFNRKYIIGEAKFLTDFGGHQNAQFEDGISTLLTPTKNATLIAIFDGVCYIPNKGKLYSNLVGKLKNANIMSSLVLRDYLYQV